MTAQAPDRIRLAGREMELYAEPLEQYFELTGTNPGFTSPSTALWRGYIATWEVREDRLYLVKLKSYLPDNRTGKLRDLFPEFPRRVFAHWYHGELLVPQGPEVGYVHAGFGAIHESMLCLAVRAGIVVDRHLEATSPVDA